MLSAYPACFIKEDTGYSVIFPDLNTATCGDDLEDAFSMAVDCLAGYLYSSNLEGENVPPASVLQDIDIQKIMDELEVTSNEAFVNIVVHHLLLPPMDVLSFPHIHLVYIVHNLLPASLVQSVSVLMH